MSLRPSLWTVVFGALEWLAQSEQWVQVDDDHASIDEVIGELEKASFFITPARCFPVIGQEITLHIDPPPAWALRCDGATYANVDYPELAAVIHPGLVVDADHFRVPDRNRRLPMDGIYPGTQEGSETHTNTVGELVPHHHSYTETVLSVTAVLGELTGFALADDATSNTSDTGGGDEYSVLNPVEGAPIYIVARSPQAGD